MSYCVALHHVFIVFHTLCVAVTEPIFFSRELHRERISLPAVYSRDDIPEYAYALMGLCTPSIASSDLVAWLLACYFACGAVTVSKWV